MSEAARNEIESIGEGARAAAWELAALPSESKDAALRAVKAALLERREAIATANRQDKAEGERLVADGQMSRALFKRLDLEGAKFDGVLAGIDDLCRLPDPVGRVEYGVRLDEGLDLYRVTCPLGVLGVIFEARPDAAVQISTLALKSANAVILKGGREAERTNQAIVAAIREGLSSVSGFPADSVQLISTREQVRDLLELDDLVDLIIPRGSNELVRSIQATTRIPVLGHADGICSVYIDGKADPEKAEVVVVDSKTQYPAVCNATETLLVHRDVLATVLPRIGKKLTEAGVGLRADAESLRYLPGAKPAVAGDFETEFLDLQLAVKTVGSVGEAVDHINRHGSHHTDSIVTEDLEAAEYFLARVDSAGVFHNASTRFADGYRYGLGAEVGISTNKTHARGPVGLEGLVIYKYRLYGSGQGVAGYGSGQGKKPFAHEPLPADGERHRPPWTGGAVS
jgi:glutamate-5-semialdehyde dehydrogenase